MIDERLIKGPDGQKWVWFMLRGWRDMDTSLAHKLTDEELLAAVETIPISVGWGLIAELMQRYERKIKASDG